MSAAYHSTLRPEPQPLIGYFLLALTGHGGAAVLLMLTTVLGSYCRDTKPILDPDQSMEVSVVVLPKANKPLPDKASRRPRPTGQPKPTPAPPPPQPQVQTSDLAVHKEKAPVEEGTPDADRKRQELMKALERQAMLDNLMAPEGDEDRQATDPNSTSDEALNALGAGAIGDPEYARYIAKLQALLMQHFRPLSSDPDLLTEVHIAVDPATGRISDYRIIKSSGVAAFDVAETDALARAEAHAGRGDEAR